MTLSLIEASAEREREEYREYMQSQAQPAVTLGDLFGDQLRGAASQAPEPAPVAEAEAAEEAAAGTPEPAPEAEATVELAADSAPDPAPAAEAEAAEEPADEREPEPAERAAPSWRPAELPELPEDV